MTFKTTTEASSTLKGAVASKLRRHSKSARRVEALRDVSFEVPTGSVYGVVGRNGAGKSTLFRVIAGVYVPQTGRVTIAGRVTPLLSLGLGFNRELSGRENILLGGLANGLDVDLIRSKSDEILEFADIGDAIDSPMRTYSNGMFARVGFAVGAFLEPEIMLIDEALGAGDAVFRAKCTAKIRELCEGSDTTIMLITHGLELVKQLADRALWLENGAVRGEGAADEIVDQYLQSNHAESAPMDDM